MKHFHTGQFLAAMSFVALGIFLLLINIGIISMEMTEAFVFFYPFLLFLLGGKYVVDALMPTKKKKRMSTGVLFLTLGLLLVMDRFHIITFSLWSIWKLWPLLFVFIGIKLLGKFRNNHGFSLVRSHSYKKENWKVESIHDWSFVCDYDFDFSTTFIPEEEIVINLSGFVGDISILIPEEIPFKVEGSAHVISAKIDKHNQDAVGRGHSLDYQTVDFEESMQRLVFQFDFSVLDVRVDRI
ncbi:cell wall-active antibiotics response protein [Bacillus sp. NTK071]|uniref:cell wall-active antibiotics response protein LiaF n=1 Tax=Bacillus sp. NTK071 TaxID=2802175 RepID=UPI001A8D7713|nr:cell wall-active antibiotics response protein LiaF [Bacillus sp. NTK071]MBN8209353.1 cell wall-active antibiotics response protein [Bacillus sp. NTK071]